MGAEQSMFDCTVCSEKFNEISRVPKLLGCHHTFCVPCLTTLCINTGLNGTIMCPVCRSITIVLHNPAVSLTTNFYLLDMLRFREQNCSTLMDVENKRNYIWCKTCSKLALKDCLGHDIADYDEFINDLKNKIRVMSAVDIETFQDLVAVNADMCSIWRSTFSFSNRVRQATEENSKTIHTLQTEMSLDINDCSELELIGTMQRLRDCRTRLEPYFHSVNVFNSIVRYEKVLITPCDKSGMKLGETVEVRLERDAHNGLRNQDEREIFLYLLRTVFCRNILPDFELMSLPNLDPQEPDIEDVQL